MLGILILGTVAAEMTLPLRMARRLYGKGGMDAVLKRDEICSALLRGDIAAANAPIALKAPRREFTNLGEVILLLAGRGGRPFEEIPASQLFSGLPADQGPLRSCEPQGMVSFDGNKFSTGLYLGYPKSRLTVTLHYSAGLFSSKLQRIEIGGLEPVTRATPPAGEFERGVAGYIKKLDEMSGRPAGPR